MCRDEDDGWIAVEIKRIGTIDAVEQLTRYLERIRLDPAMADCRGVLAAQAIKPQARMLAESRGIAWVEVDLAVLRGEREPDLDAVRLARQARHERPRSAPGRAAAARARSRPAPARARRVGARSPGSPECRR